MPSEAHTSAARRRIRLAQVEVILAAVAFAASVPANKLLLAGVTPLSLSGALYLSAGILCAVLLFISQARSASGSVTTTLRGTEWVWLAGAVLSGAVLAPLLLFVGLRQVSGHAAGLLLNFEAVF